MASTLINNRYRVKQSIGQGGFGKTYLAIDTHLPSRPFLVLKEMRPVSQEPKTKELVRQRFEREAVVLEKLGKSHSQIPSLYAFFSESDRFFLVQEWIEGQTLTEKLKTEGKLKEEEVKDILIEVLSILEYVHDKGIIHRDIKPDNIIIRKSDNKPVLIDFGAVKEVMGIHFNSHGSLNSSVRIGTPGFIAPEQAIGRPIHSSDLYSLGLTAIYLISGKLPQEFPTNQVTSDIEWQPHCPTLSPWFQSVLSKVAQNNPPDRYTSAKEMKNALQSKSTAVFSNSFSTQTQSNQRQKITVKSQPLTQSQQSTEFQSSSQKRSKNKVIISAFSLLVICSFSLPFLWLQLSSVLLSNRLSANNAPPVNNDVAGQSDELSEKNEPEENPDQAEADRQAEIAEQQAEADRQAEIAEQQAEADRQAEIAEQQAEADRQAEIAEQQAEADRQAEIARQRAEADRQAEIARQAEADRREAAARREELRNTYCVVTISNSLVSLMSEPDRFSQEMARVPSGEYIVLDYASRTFVNQRQRWLQIEVNDRRGWIADDTWTIEAKSPPCQ